MRPNLDDTPSLPPPGTTRWVASRKAAVARAVESGGISAQWAIDAYDLTAEELDAWRRALTRHGTGALRTTRLREYRRRKHTDDSQSEVADTT